MINAEQAKNDMSFLAKNLLIESAGAPATQCLFVLTPKNIGMSIRNNFALGSDSITTEIGFDWRKNLDCAIGKIGILG